jgi:hypothetical protein
VLIAKKNLGVVCKKPFVFMQVHNIIFLLQEYVGDGIDWTNVEFVDNTDCLNLFEKVCLLCASNH